MAKKYVYSFGGGKADGNESMKNLLGGKGANLAEMAGIGLPVPPGFTISTEVCNLFFKAGNRLPKDVEQQIMTALKRLEKPPGLNSATRLTRSWFQSGREPNSACPV